MRKVKSEYELVHLFFKARRKYPAQSVAFVLYFIGVILIVGLTASFISLFGTIDFKNNLDIGNISLSLIGYSLVLLCSSAIELIFISFKDDEQDFFKIKNAVSMIGIFSILFGIAISILTYWIQINWIKALLSLLMCITSLYLWWISNSRTLSVLAKDAPPNTEDITGGNPVEEEVNGVIPKDFKS